MSLPPSHSRNTEFGSDMTSFDNSSLQCLRKVFKMEPEQLLEDPAAFKRRRILENATQLQGPSLDYHKLSIVPHMLPFFETVELSTSCRSMDGLKLRSIEKNISTSHFNALVEPRPLGLMLRKSPSLLDLIQRRLTQNDDSDSGAQHDTQLDPPARACEKDKLKAANFPAFLLRIGSWECTSRYDGDLVAKCYYAKRKLVWEILDQGLKSKMEIQWSDISALKADFPEDQLSTLDIELFRPPLFFREINPQPRKHTLWQSTPDFTNGQATVCRHHSVQFPVGVLNRHFEKLLQCDAHLQRLSASECAIRDSCFFPEPKIHMDAQQVTHSQSLFPNHASVVQHLAPMNMLIPHNVLVVEKISAVQSSLMEEEPLHAMSDVHGFPQLHRNLLQAPPFSTSHSSVINGKNGDESSGSESEEVSSRETNSYQTSNLNVFEHSHNLGLRPVRHTIDWDSLLAPEGRATRVCTPEQEVLNELSLHLLGEPLPSSEKQVHMMGKVKSISED